MPKLTEKLEGERKQKERRSVGGILQFNKMGDDAS
jgi:hypothetical protein